MDELSRMIEDRNRRMLRARDAMDRGFSQPLEVPAVAQVAHVSPAHFSRQFRATFGEPPHRYLQRRRVERAMELLRETERPITEICLDVGFNSLGTFSRVFREIVGESPSTYRARVEAGTARGVPACWAMAWMRPAS
ncbi:MAG: helix-turn-helix transcriptional regulator [Actinobacteria bacterium]|nr:MAG: helix-turn-helix transcriptional regulator [Actinomycetota bacterium]